MLNQLNSTTACGTFVTDDQHFSYYTATNALLAIAAGQLITAIKILRRLDNHGLKEGKDIVEACIKGCHDRMLQRQGDISATLQEIGTFVVVSESDWDIHSLREATDIADARARHEGNQYVARVIRKVTMEVKVENVA
jgi:hypothetical protein